MSVALEVEHTFGELSTEDRGGTLGRVVGGLTRPQFQVVVDGRVIANHAPYGPPLDPQKRTLVWAGVAVLVFALLQAVTK